LGAGTVAVGTQALPGAQQLSTGTGVNAGAVGCDFPVATGIILVGVEHDEPALQQSSRGVSDRFSDFMP